MTLEVKENLTDQEVNELLEKVEPLPKLFDARKYFNKASINFDPLLIQQEMRDE